MVHLTIPKPSTHPLATDEKDERSGDFTKTHMHTYQYTDPFIHSLDVGITSGRNNLSKWLNVLRVVLGVKVAGVRKTAGGW